jgi:hypothetical protein
MKEIVKLDIIQEEIVDGLVVDSWGLSNALKKPGTRILTQWIEESCFPTPTQAVPQVAKFLIVRTMDKESRLVQLQEELDLTKNVLDKKRQTKL